jgi:acyl CoA:acetate/3-ketoacid CoA transferase alpha subunit
MDEITAEQISQAAQRLADRFEAAAAKGEPYTLEPADLSDLALVFRSMADRARSDVEGAEGLIV